MIRRRSSSADRVSSLQHQQRIIYLFPNIPCLSSRAFVSRYTTAPNPPPQHGGSLVRTMYAVVRNQMSVNRIVAASYFCIFSAGLCDLYRCVWLWTSWCVSVLTALQVNKPQLPVSVLVFPRNFDGQSAETVVGDGAGACLVSYLLCIGRHHFH